MIGLSLSLCIRDVLEGRVNEVEIGLIVADVTAPTGVDMHNVLSRYQESYWRTDPERGREIARRLLKAGKIVQPRLLEDNHEHNIGYGHWVLDGQYLLARHTMEPLMLCNRCQHYSAAGMACEYCEHFQVDREESGYPGQED